MYSLSYFDWSLNKKQNEFTRVPELSSVAVASPRDISSPLPPPESTETRQTKVAVPTLSVPLTRTTQSLRVACPLSKMASFIPTLPPEDIQRAAQVSMRLFPSS